MSLSSIKVNNTQLNWDDEPIAGSDNLVKSGGVYKTKQQAENSQDLINSIEKSLFLSYSVSFEKTAGQSHLSDKILDVNVPAGSTYGIKVSFTGDDTSTFNFKLYFSNGTTKTDTSFSVIGNSLEVDFPSESKTISGIGLYAAATIPSGTVVLTCINKNSILDKINNETLRAQAKEGYLNNQSVLSVDTISKCLGIGVVSFEKTAGQSHSSDKVLDVDIPANTPFRLAVSFSGDNESSFASRIYFSDGTYNNPGLITANTKVDFEAKSKNITGIGLYAAATVPAGTVSLTCGVLLNESILNNLIRLNSSVSDLDFELYGDGIKQPVLSDVLNGNIRSNAKWGIYSDSTGSLIIDVSAYRGKNVTAVSSFETKQYAFLSAFGGTVHDAQSTFCENCTRQETYPNNVEIPSDCNYLYLLVKSGSVTVLPAITISDTTTGLVQRISDLENEEKDNIFVRWTGTKFEIYQRLHNTKYFAMLEIIHDVDNSDTEYRNVWRLKTNGGIFEYDGIEFDSKNIKLLHTLENEFTFKYVGASDFTGGFHGDERIDIDPSCYIRFILDGVLLTQEELSTSFSKWCNSFNYVQRSTLHQTAATAGQYVENHPIIAYHLKQTYFENGGYRTVNRIDIDLSNSVLTELVTDTIFTGLACIHKDTAEVVSVDTGNIIQTAGDAHSYYFNGEDYPLSITLLYNGYNTVTKASSRAISKEVTKPTHGHNTLEVWDRVNDSKYYGFAPNRTFVSGDIFVSEMEVCWEYKA